MAIAFLTPAALWAAGLAVLPITIHLFTRTATASVLYQAGRVPEPARRALGGRGSGSPDRWLLMLRTLAILLAVTALAGPVVVTPARQATWRARLARAVVLDDRTAAAEDELRSATAARVFARDRLQDAVADAVRWLEQQGAIRQELVVLSAFRRSSSAPETFAIVPPATGIRLVRTSNGSSVREREISRLVWRQGRAVRVTERLTLAPGATAVREAAVEPLDEVPIRVTAAPAEQEAADAALRAVLQRGLRLPPAGLLEPIEMPWPGSVEHLAAALETRLAAPLDAWEPDTWTDAERTALEREPAAIDEPLPVDAGDRRLAWAAVLCLLVAELWLRQEFA